MSDTKKKNLIYLLIFTFISQTTLSFAGGIPIPSATCDGSQWFDGTFIPRGQVKEVYYGGVKYRCVGCGGCTPLSGSSSNSSTYTPSYTPSSRLSPSQQLAIGVMGAFLSGFFSTLFSPPDFSDDDYQKRREYEEQQRKLEEEKKKQEEMKKKLLSQYNTLLAQAKSQVQVQSSQNSSSSIAFQTLGGQLTPFQWNTPASPQSKPSDDVEKLLITTSDINSIVGNVIQEKVTENLEEKIEEYGGKIVDKLDKKYGKQWGSRYYEKGLPILKIAIAAKTEGVVGAGVEMINLGISLVPMPTMQGEIADVGRKIYSKIAFSTLDKFLSETERAGELLGFNFNKDEFWQDLENDMNTGQKIIYKWLKGE